MRNLMTADLILIGLTPRVSAWTWSATLLQSSTAAYTFGEYNSVRSCPGNVLTLVSGISGPWWYGVGGTIQLGIFGMVAAKVKMNANGAHTFLEVGSGSLYPRVQF